MDVHNDEARTEIMEYAGQQAGDLPDMQAQKGIDGQVLVECGARDEEAEGKDGADGTADAAKPYALNPKHPKP